MIRANRFARIALRIARATKDTLIFFSLLFWISLLFPFKEIPAFSSVFCLCSKDFRGSPARTNPCHFCGFFLVFPKRQEKEDQGIAVPISGFFSISGHKSIHALGGFKKALRRTFVEAPKPHSGVFSGRFGSDSEGLPGCSSDFWSVTPTFGL